MTRLSAIFALAIFAATAAHAEPSALVALARSKQGTLSAKVTAYGSVAADPDHQIAVVVLHDARVTAVSVRAGQAVEQGDPLLTIQDAPASAVAYAQAKSSLDFATKDLEQTRRLFGELLVTRGQLAASEKAYSDARAVLDQQRASGADRGTDVLRAPARGVIVSLSASRGDSVTAGTAVAAIASRKNLVVNLGIEPADAPQIRVGATVQLRSQQNGAIGFTSHIASIGQMIDPQTRLVNAAARVPDTLTPQLLVGATLTAQVDMEPHKGVIVPRAALLSDGDGSYVFVVSKGVAHRRKAQPTVQTEDKMLIAKGLSANEWVAVSGVAGLEDGMRVRTQ